MTLIKPSSPGSQKSAAIPVFSATGNLLGQVVGKQHKLAATDTGGGFLAPCRPQLEREFSCDPHDVEVSWPSRLFFEISSESIL